MNASFVSLETVLHNYLCNACKFNTFLTQTVHKRSRLAPFMVRLCDVMTWWPWWRGDKVVTGGKTGKTCGALGHIRPFSLAGSWFMRATQTDNNLLMLSRWPSSWILVIGSENKSSFNIFFLVSNRVWDMTSVWKPACQYVGLHHIREGRDTRN